MLQCQKMLLGIPVILFMCTTGCDKGTSYGVVSALPSLATQAGLWGTAEDGHLVTIHCPPGYCSCYYTTTANVTMPGNATTAICSSVLQLRHPDAQCACSRQGYLCGACVSGLSVTAVLSTCKSCDNTWIIGIVMLSESIVPSTSWCGGCVCVTACVRECVCVCCNRHVNACLFCSCHQ